MNEDHDSVFCIKSIKRAVNVDITPRENFSLGDSLASIYPLLEIIFKKLPFNDLKTCSKVSQLWKKTAEDILNKEKVRQKHSWFTCYKLTKKPKGFILNHSKNLNFNNAKIGIIMYDSVKISLNKYICIHSNTSDLTRKSVIEYLDDELVPKSIDYCVLSVPRVISHFSVSRPDTNKIGLPSVIDGVFIPSISNIRTTIFHCNPSRKAEIEETVKKYIRPNEEVKCLLLFCKKQLGNSLYNLLDILVPQENPTSMALGGAVIKGTQTFQAVDPQKKMYTVKDTVCIAFLKEKKSECTNFNAYSCVVKGEDLSDTEFDTELTEFKENITLKTHSLCFRICCAAKHSKDHEITSYDNIFPGVPLLGLDAYGEIGWNCYESSSHINNEYTRESRHRKRSKKSYDLIYPDAENFWSTIFVMITWD